MENNSNLIKFGENIRYLRRKVNLSQEALAELCGLHRTYIGGIERGERNVALLNILRISQALNVKPCDLLEGLE